MPDSSRNLIVLSDGTGNSASKPFKTNVWRLYQAIDLTDGTQVAAFGDGVGTSSIKILRVLGLALGIGVKRNVLNLYKFLCRNYKDGGRIWAFGFSRGAFTVRVLAGLIHHEGMVTFESETELNRNALAAYRAYRKQAFATMIPWVVVGRYLRDRLISAWNLVTGVALLRGGQKQDGGWRPRSHQCSFRRGLGHRRRLWAADRRAHAGGRQMGLADEIPRRFLVVQRAVRSARTESRRRAQNLSSDSMERGEAPGHRSAIRS